MQLLKRPMVTAAILALFCCMIGFYSGKIASALFVVFAFLLIFSFPMKFDYKLSVVFLATVLLLFSITATNYRADRLRFVNEKSKSVDFVAVGDMEYQEGNNRIKALSLDDDIIPKFSKFQLYCSSGLDVKSGQRFTAKVYFSQFESSAGNRSYYGDDIFIASNVEHFESFNGNNKFFKFLGDIRKYISDTINENTSLNTASFLNALVCGDKSMLSDKMLDDIRACGVSHMIVVSGLHLSIIMSGLAQFLNTFIYNRSIKCALYIFAVLAVVAICGFTVSVIRSAVMFIAVSLAPVFKRENDSLNSLGLAVFLILLVSPYAVFELSFQYSVLATLAIVWVVPFYNDLLCKMLRIKFKVLKNLVSILVTTVLATAFTLPITIRQFGEVSVVSPIVNIVINFPVTYALTLSVAGIIFGMDFISYPAFWLSELCTKFSMKVISVFADSKFAVVTIGYSGFILSVCFIVMLPLLMYMYKYKRQISKSKERGSEESADF